MGEEVLVLASRLKKRDSPGKFYKSSVVNKSYFHKPETLLIITDKKLKDNFFYWLKSSRFRFQREKVFCYFG